MAEVLRALDATYLRSNHCYFGGGTRIALELDEYRESQDVDLLCADLSGYRVMRSQIGERSLGTILAQAPERLTLMREVRADQYGIRTIVGFESEPVKFEIILEARIDLDCEAVPGVPVACLDRTSCFAEKWLANADCWNDIAVMARDAIDLAFMLSAWGIAPARAGADRAERAYGAAIRRAAISASATLIEDRHHRKRCAEALGIEDSKALLAALRKLARLVNAPDFAT